MRSEWGERDLECEGRRGEIRYDRWGGGGGRLSRWRWCRGGIATYLYVSKVTKPRILCSLFEFMLAILNTQEIIISLPFGRCIFKSVVQERLTFTSGWSGATPNLANPNGVGNNSYKSTRMSWLAGRESNLEAAYHPAGPPPTIHTRLGVDERAGAGVEDLEFKVEEKAREIEEPSWVGRKGIGRKEGIRISIVSVCLQKAFRSRLKNRLATFVPSLSSSSSFSPTPYSVYIPHK